MKTIQQETRAKILDGTKVSGAIIDCVRESIAGHVNSGGRRPGLAVVLVGNDPASSIYVRAKRRDCERAGILARDYDLEAGTSQQQLLELIDRLNEEPDVDGILVQLPLPAHIDETSVTNRINCDKDVDGPASLLRYRQPIHACRRGGRIEHRRPPYVPGIAVDRVHGNGKPSLHAQPGGARAQC
jgi:methylenetetrahydrofolate dehydrogenase (NADP+)/methenyltetrahydrofolate cyclohydrolase